MPHRKLEQAAKGMSYNLHFIRFIAAMLVIMSHSFALSVGDFDNEWFYVATDTQITMGAFAVGIFFFYSGFLIMRSLEKKSKVSEFIAGRCVRIFPVLIVVVFLTVLVVGPIATSYSLQEYFGSRGTYEYLLNCIFVLKHTLPGVFENNVYTATINGALWTLPVEFVCYILCLVACKMKILIPRIMWITVPIVAVGSGGVCFIAERWDIEMLTTVLFPVMCFYAGVLMCVYKKHIVLDMKIFIACLILFVVSTFMGMMKIGFVLFFLYVLIYLAFGSRSMKGKAYKLGNYSYAMYLCGFPIQQLIVWANGGRMDPVYNMLIAIPFIMAISVLLYYFVEEKTINLYKARLKNGRSNKKSH